MEGGREVYLGQCTVEQDGQDELGSDGGLMESPFQRLDTPSRLPRAKHTTPRKPYHAPPLVTGAPSSSRASPVFSRACLSTSVVLSGALRAQYASLFNSAPSYPSPAVLQGEGW